ncbi:MAG: nucleotidyltransferase [Chloroflexi bacterium]|nr:nucleotidyltransferase [Chloroflexota bacterium]MYD49649.1 nucleotidyltransferase [Chloroflexota bacterium]
MTKNNRPFREFLRYEVNLNQDRLHRLQVSVRDVNRHLKGNLPGYQRIDRQGSYGLDTLVKPVNENDEYDADIQVVINPNPNWKARDYLNALCETLSREYNFADKIEMGNRCVTLNYAGDFHLDVVPRVTRQGGHFICNWEKDCFEETDGTGYRNWFSEKSRITRVNLKRAVRLLKYVRDRQHNYVAKSILLTTLAGNAINSSDRGTEAVRTVANTLTTVLTRMDGYLQRHPIMPEIKNPAMLSEDFNRHWNQDRYDYFRERVHSHAQIAQQALASPSIEDSIRLWRRLLGNNFGRGRIG